MITLVINNLFGKIIEVGEPGVTVLRALHDNHVDWMHSCGGKGRCTTCKFKVLKGLDRLSEMTPAEVGYSRQNLLGADERLACQARVYGDLELSVPHETKLPHISYSDRPAPS